MTPTYAQELFEQGLLDDERDGRPGGHRPALVLLGGEAVSDAVWDRLRDTEGVLGYNLYGPTEYTINTLGGGTDDSATPDRRLADLEHPGLRARRRAAAGAAGRARRAVHRRRRPGPRLPATGPG